MISTSSHIDCRVEPLSTLQPVKMFLGPNLAFASHDWNVFPHNLMLLNALVIDDPVQKLKWNIFKKKNWTWVSNQSQIEIAHCVGMRLTSFEGGLLQTDLIQATSNQFYSRLDFVLIYFSLHWMMHIDAKLSLLTFRFLPWCHSVAFSTLMAFSIFKFHFTSLFLTLMLHFLPWCHSVAFSTSMQHFLI